MRRTRGACLAATVVVTAGALIAACSGAGPTPPGEARPTVVEASPAAAEPGPSRSPSPPPSVSWASAADVRASGLVVQPGGVGVTVLGTVTVEDGGEGSAVVTLAVEPSATDPVVGALAAPEGGSLEPLADGSVLVRDAAGVRVAALGTPRTTSLSAEWEAAAADLLLLNAQPGSEAGAGTVRLWLAGATVLSVDWGEREGGRSLAVVPSAWMRAGGQAAGEKGWSDLIALVPEADVPGMQNQMTCHAIGAADKDSWNLEPWRPDVGLLETLAARCNP